MKQRQYRSNQGRSPEQLETSYRLVGWSFVGIIVTLLASVLFELW